MWDYFSKDIVGRQLVKAADSIGANIIESQGRYHPKGCNKFSLYSERFTKRNKILVEKGIT